MEKPLFYPKLYLASAVLFCLISAYPLLGRADTQNEDDKTVAVNQQLNMFESPQSHADGVAQEFSSPGPEVIKESPNVHPEMQNDGSLLKEVLSPHLNQNPQTRHPSNVITRVHTLDAGAEISYYRYVVPKWIFANNNNVVRIKDVGPMYGFFADYAYRPQDPNFLNNFISNVYMLQARYAGSRDLNFSGEGNVKGKHDDIMEFRGLIGKDYFVGTDLRLTPYFGFGYRYLYDRGNGQITSLNYLQEDNRSHYYYLPLGGNATFEMPKNWEIDVNGEYDFFIQGIQKSYYSEWNKYGGPYTYSNLVFRQNFGFGLRTSVKFIKHGPMVDFYVEPYLRYWDIEQSKPETQLYQGTSYSVVEPANSTVEVGTKFGVQF